MQSEKANIIALLHILAEYSDENHILPMREIISRLNEEYGITPDRRTIYSLITNLQYIGLDISDFEENGVGYYLKRRQFDTADIRLLMDAVYSFPYITPGHAADLVERLQLHLSVYDRKKFENLTLSKPGVNSPYRRIFWIIELLDTAISRKVKVKFAYVSYDFEQKLVPRRSETYTVNPYGLVCTKENYYLVCSEENKKEVSLYRIDRMRDIVITDRGLDPRGKDSDPKKIVEQAIYACNGEPEPIVMHCDREIIDCIVDKYGTDIDAQEVDDQKIKISITVPPDGVKAFALQFLPHVEVISPQWLRDQCEYRQGNDRR
jgi:predicted DNA-binding transcriptional regulator YafY